MRPQPVDGLEPAMALADAAKRIVSVRAAELFSLGPAALEAGNPTALHDLRIAAKRLRYVLELVGFCIDEVVAEAATRARDLQTLIGEIHDYDVLLARIDGAGAKHPKGFARLARRLAAQRGERFARFTALWAAIESSGLAARLGAATDHSPDAGPMAA